MKTTLNSGFKFCFALLCILVGYGCSTQQDTGANRRLHNLSARYNYIYNSNLLLANYQDQLVQTYVDDYSQPLPLYIAPHPSSGDPSVVESKELDEIARKAQTIINEKNLSNYIDEAYLLLGKTNFYKGNYYNAAEFFGYVERAYKKDKNVYLQALDWKARTYLQLNNDKMALRILDSVKVTLDSVKRHKAEPLATLAQNAILQQDYPQAISYLEKAIKASKDRQRTIRWTYGLAQLQEIQRDYAASLKNYVRVEHSNAPFEMYFNALLSKIRINDKLNPNAVQRSEALLKLRKDDKNLDYLDQIYYEVAEDYLAANDYKNAETFFKRAVSESKINANLKGLAYLKLADLHFNTLKDYVNAKLYYDSALLSLAPTYPTYEQLSRKAQNLTYLSDRYQLINAQDSLQLLARLSPQERDQQIARRFEVKEVAAAPSATQTAPTSERTTRNADQNQNTTFYFGSQAAVSRGFTDFKRRWGNRSLDNNWRQSVKSSATLNQQLQTNVNQADDQPAGTTGTADQLANQIAAYTALIPLTPDQLNRSNQVIIDALFEIGSFYQQVLEDEKEAVKVYEELLRRFPKNRHLESIYYSLYLGYQTTDPEKSAHYKTQILGQYPNSVYAKSILDPAYSSKQSALDVEINKQYNVVFELYEEKNYPAVIEKVSELNQRFPGNALQIQYDYLKAIAIGKTAHVDSLLLAFNRITGQYQADSLITPLVKGHIDYINANLNTFKARKIALLDFDETEPRFVAQQAPKIAAPVVAAPLQQATVPPPVQQQTPVTAAPVQQAPVKPDEPATPTVKTDGLFTTAETAPYYYVVSVSTTQVSLSSSRFGIGQFNRGNYAGDNLRHALSDLDQDQLIYVGNFETVNAAKAYSDEIKPQLPKIMKVAANLYQGFFISKENFDKIKDRTTLNRYIEFFKANY